MMETDEDYENEDREVFQRELQQARRALSAESKPQREGRERRREKVPKSGERRERKHIVTKERDPIARKKEKLYMKSAISSRKLKNDNGSVWHITVECTGVKK